jgi:hypothetical protein
MSKIPPILLKKLAQLRRRERLLRLALGAARVAALLLAVLLAACAVDWLIDLWDETPWALRVGMLVGQLALAAVALALLVLLPLLTRLRDDALALFVEDKCPELQHRLISALQLNRAGARIEGMSPELLAAMTKEAAQQVATLPCAALADHRRLGHGLLLLAPVSLVIAALALLFPETVSALLQRQLLADIDIPRTVELASDTPEIWPSGEDVVLRFKARGAGLDAGRTGTVRVRPDGQPSFTVPLTFEALQEGTAIFTARLRPASVDFLYTARLGDGRTRKPSRVRYVPRPSIDQQEAYVLLPRYLDYSRRRARFEQHQPTGDVIGMPDLAARIVARTQKPIFRAVLQTYGSPYPDLSGPTGLSKTHQDRVNLASTLSALAMSAAPNTGALTALGPATAAQQSVPLRRFEWSSAAGAKEVQWQIDLRPTETTYSIVVFDEYGFASKTYTVRALRIEPEPPPTVELLAESWSAAPEFSKGKSKHSYADFEGLPLPIVSNGKPGPMPISYKAFGPYGIGKVQLKIAVFRGQNNSGDRLRRGIVELWGTLELEEFAQSPRRPRRFDLSTGAFEDSTNKEQIYFYPLPLSIGDDKAAWPRMLAGGRFDYKVAGFIDVRTGRPFVFQPDDHVVVYLEVFNRNPDPKKALMARSARAREKDVTTLEIFVKVLNDTLQEAERLAVLMRMQEEVYDRPWLSIFGFK